MNIKGLRVFILTIEEGTLAKASERLNISQPAASRLLNLLEEHLGVLLFSRVKKRLIPTVEAEAFYNEATRVLASVDGIPSFIKELQQGKLDFVRVVCIQRLASRIVLPAITKLSKNRPEFRVRLEVNPSRYFDHSIARELYDVGVGYLPVPAQNIESQYLFTTSLHVVLPKNHIFANKTYLKSEDLLHQSYIALHPRSMLRKAVDENLNQSNVVLVPQHEMSSPALACQLVREGLGFTIVDPLWIDYEQRDKYCFVPLKPKTSIDFGIFTNKSSPPSKAKDEFIDCLKEISTEVLGELK